MRVLLASLIPDASSLPNEDEPKTGRILVLAVDRDTTGTRLSLVSEYATRGAALVLVPFHGKVLAGVSGRVELFSWRPSGTGRNGLTPECRYVGNTLVVALRSQGDFVLAGDLMASMSLLSYR